MSAPTSHSEFSKNEAGHSPETSNLRIKERGSDETEGTGDLSQDLDQESDLEYATSFRLMIIMATLSLSTLIAALDLVSITHVYSTTLFDYCTKLT